MNKKQSEAMTRVQPTLVDLDARCLWQVKGPNNSILEARVVGQSVVIFQYFAEGGVAHYVPGVGGTFDAMVTQLHQLAATVV